jgi:CheY-like chemotaxis protein
VLVSDIGMPEHDGYEFISQVRRLPNGRALPAVALTALARAEDRTRALRAGFQMHLAKPVDADELVTAIRNLAQLGRH